MKTVAISTFVRDQKFYSELPKSDVDRLNHTKKMVELLKAENVPHTFLLEYDALVSKEYQELFLKNKSENMEIGLWYEIVRQLTDKAGLPWRGEEDKNWDWHIVPGFSMAYTNEERERLLDIAMEDFKSAFGYYPKTLAAWQMDTHTLDYAYNKYGIEVAAICRDQVNCDAYTLVGGYFSGGYYPSKKNIFTPAQNSENQIDVPVLRLLGPDPVHNYDNDKYLKNYEWHNEPFTLEAGWPIAKDEDRVRWFFDTYYKNESLGFAFTQIGQENPFCRHDVIPTLKMHIDILKKEYSDVQFVKMSEAGKLFKEKFTSTPATCVCALKDWDRPDEVQSVYYDCKNYVANLFRCGDKIFLRGLYLFDENFEDHYLNTPCETWFAVNENLPLADTINREGNEGALIDNSGEEFTVEKTKNGVLKAAWQDKSVVFEEDAITFTKCGLTFDLKGIADKPEIKGNDAVFEYKGKKYAVSANMKPEINEETLVFKPRCSKIKLTFKRF